jgi:hypothetical protein
MKSSILSIALVSALGMSFSACTDRNSNQTGTGQTQTTPSTSTQTTPSTSGDQSSTPGARTNTASGPSGASKSGGNSGKSTTGQSTANSSDADAAGTKPSAGGRPGQGTRTGNTSRPAGTSNSSGSRTWKQFQSQVTKCDAMTGDQQEQCMANAKATYRASDFDCNTLTGPSKAQCEKYGTQWNNSSQDAYVHSGEPSTTSTGPADPTEALKNRDSRKQGGNASSALPEPHKQN